jgi:sec-independent protein translocase protein TatA
MGALTGHLPEVIIVLVVILIIWGPGKLPDVGAALGRGIREFRKASSDAQDAVVHATTVAPAQTAPVAVQADATPHTPVSG